MGYLETCSLFCAVVVRFYIVARNTNFMIKPLPLREIKINFLQALVTAFSSTDQYRMQRVRNN